MDLTFMMYADHNDKLDDFVDALARSEDPTSKHTQRHAARSVGLDLSLIDRYDQDYIESRLERKYNIYI